MKVRKKVFMPWQKFISNLAFMYQGILLFISAVAACTAFYLTVSLLLHFADRIYVTEIAGGEMVTRLASPMFWLAVVFVILLAVFIILSTPITKLLMKTLSAGEDVGDTRSFNIKRRIRMSKMHFYVYALTVFLLFLYSSAVFSLTLKNGTIEYLFIFISVALLSALAQKLLAYPVFCAMKKHEISERKRRDAATLITNRDEGEEAINVCRKELSKEEFPAIYACAERAAKALRYKIDNIEVSFGFDAADASLDDGLRKVRLSLGVSLLEMLNERQLEAYLTAFFVRRHNGSPKSLESFIKLNEALDFCASSWNPTDRLYFPLRVLLLTECNECVVAVRKSVAGSVEKYSLKAGDSFIEALSSASLKKAVYLFIPFAYDKSFYHPLLKGNTPVRDYLTRLTERFFAYVEKNEEKIYDAFTAMTENDLQFSDFDPHKIVSCIKNKKISLTSRPEGAYAVECKKIAEYFDYSFALLAEPNYEKKSERLYRSKVRRITEFEKDLVAGKDKSLDEKISAAEDYLSLMMPEAAIDVLRDADSVSLSENARLNLTLGEAMLRLGDMNGLSALVAATRINFRCTFKAITTAERLLAANGKLKEYSKLSETFRTGLAEYVRNDPSADNLIVMEELTGKYKAPSALPCTSFDDSEKKTLANALAELCGEDRLEWAALVNVKKNDTELPTLIVRCNEIHPGGYTDSYRDGVYISTADSLSNEIRLFGDTYPKTVFARLVYDAEIEAFEAIDGAIIYRKGAVEAQKILSLELSSFLREDDSDYVEFEGGEEHTGDLKDTADNEGSDDDPQSK